MTSADTSPVPMDISTTTTFNSTPLSGIDPNTEPITRPVQIIVEGGKTDNNNTNDDENSGSSSKQQQQHDSQTKIKTKIVNTVDSQTLHIALDDQERQLFDSLIETAHALEEGTLIDDTTGAAIPKKTVQIRVAGGWVRDKILGLVTHDVDIALDTCTGVEFAQHFKMYMNAKQKQQEQEEGNGNNDKKKPQKSFIGKIGVIAANPEQSKHLETATLKAFGIEVDFSNLRHETYADDSRIPTTVIGTPLEDSYRRDFTINALYYHLQTNRVEDWTRQGLIDLLSPRAPSSTTTDVNSCSQHSFAKIKTPLPPYQTFHDDPLRVLRAIRFTVRYEMQLDDDLKDAAMHPQIHGELHRKVSRERVGKELEGMLSGKHSNPLKALKLICDLKLAGSVFCVPADDTIMGPIGHAHLEPVTYAASDKQGFDHLRQVAWEESQECLQVLPLVIEALKDAPLDSRMLHLSVMLLPFEKLQYVVKNKAKSVAEYMMREGIKFKNKDVVSMVTIVEQLDAMGQLLQSIPEPTPAARLKAGLILRSTKDLWATTMAVAAVAMVRREGSNNSIDWFQRAREWYKMIYSDLDLDKCWTVNPLMNGKEIIQFLGLSKGPQVGMYTQDLVHWMLQHPKGTLEECKEYLKDCKKQREAEQDQAAQHISKKMHL